MLKLDGMRDAALLHALGEPRRVAILRLVREREYPAGEIAAQFPDVSGPAVSQHLRVLREAGLIEERRSGTRRLYRARPDGLAELRALLRDFWDDGLAQLKEHAQSLLRRVHLVAVLDTLENLRRGGRIGNAKALLGTLLNVKPLLEVRDSQVVPLEQVRTRAKAQERIGQIIADLGELEAVAVAESDATVGEQLEQGRRAPRSPDVETQRHSGRG